MNLAFAHHLDVRQSAETRKPGAVGIHSAAENIALHLKADSDGFHYLAPLRNICTPPAACFLPAWSGSVKAAIPPSRPWKF
ncbi:MAG: hypothetical protein WC701_00200 [Kiritimatiellales bacterium]